MQKGNLLKSRGTTALSKQWGSLKAQHTITNPPTAKKTQGPKVLYVLTHHKPNKGPPCTGKVKPPPPYLLCWKQNNDFNVCQPKKLAPLKLLNCFLFLMYIAGFFNDLFSTDRLIKERREQLRFCLHVYLWILLQPFKSMYKWHLKSCIIRSMEIIIQGLSFQEMHNLSNANAIPGSSNYDAKQMQFEKEVFLSLKVLLGFFLYVIDRSNFSHSLRVSSGWWLFNKGTIW